MTINKLEIKGKTKKHRPVGIGILTIYALIFAGIFPLLLDPFNLFVLGHTAYYSTEDVPFILAQAIINIGVVVTSILVLKGWEVARIVFLILITIYSGWLIYAIFLSITNISFINGSILEKAIFWVRGIGNIVFIILYIWYFNRPVIKEFFKKE